MRRGLKAVLAGAARAVLKRALLTYTGWPDDDPGSAAPAREWAQALFAPYCKSQMVRMLTVQAEPRPITWARPTLASGT